MSHPSAAREGTPRQLLAFAALFAAAGVELVWAAHTRDPALRVPPSVGYLVACVLLAGSAAAAAKASGRPHLVETLAVAILVGFAAIGGWIALAGGRGGCATNVPLPGPMRAAACRAAFGIGAMLSAAMALAAAARAWRRSGRETTAP